MCTQDTHLPRHGVRLAHAVDDHQTVFQFGERGEARRFAIIGQRGVYLIGEDGHFGVLAQHFDQRFQLGTAINRTRRVIG